MVKKVFKAIDDMLSMAAAVLVVVLILLALTGHLDINVIQGFKSYGLQIMFTK